jgi:hypothetical protein
MSLVEDAYWQAVDAMTPAEKFARMHAMLNWARDIYARQLRETLGDASGERIRRQYGSDSRARELIERKLRDVRLFREIGGRRRMIFL